MSNSHKGGKTSSGSAPSISQESKNNESIPPAPTKYFYSKLIAVAMIAIMTLLVYINLPDSKTNGSKSVNLDESCLVGLITIDDGLCDDAANNAMCLFDGDDCCLEHRPKVHCTDCQCKLGDHDADALAIEKESDWTKDFVNPDGLKLFKTIEHVQNDLTCMVRCLHGNQSSAWAVAVNHYIDCFCYQALAHFCPNNANLSEIDAVLVYYYTNYECKSPTTATTSYQENTPALPGVENLNQILVASGVGDSRLIEIVDLQKNRVEECCNPTYLASSAAFGGLIYYDGHLDQPMPLVCGGEFSYWVPDEFRHKPSPVYICTNLRTGYVSDFTGYYMRNFAASTVVNNQIWITGVLYGEVLQNPYYEANNDPAHASLLIRHDIAAWGANLPVANHHHCLANFKAGERIFLLGGDIAPLDVWSILYGEIDNLYGTWNQEPSLTKGRASSSCGVISDMVDPNIFYVVIAGASDLDFIDEGRSTEVMKIGSRYFRAGPRLPYHVMGAATVASEKSLVLLGGFSEDWISAPRKTILLFQCWKEDCQWILMEQELMVPRHSFVAMQIPDGLVLNCTHTQIICKPETNFYSLF